MAGRFNAIYHQQQFRPGLLAMLINPFFLLRRELYKAIRRNAPELQGRILDFGCGSKPYRELFPHASEYLGVDIENPGHDHSKEGVDFFYDGHKLPFESHSFDGIFSSEVLEHVSNPEEMLPELYRVLRPGGKILITVPFVWNEHEMPHDYFRFTREGIRVQFEKAGFRVLRVEKTGHFAMVLWQLMMLYLYEFTGRKNKYLTLLLNIVFIFPFMLLGWLLINILPRRRSLAFNQVLLAEKPGPDTALKNGKDH